MVQLYLNNQLCDLYGSEEIATDYAIAPIANIASRTGAKSVSFKIPLTANNREIIENANVIVNDSTLPYQLIPAQLKANGLDQNLEFAQIKSIKDDISLSLFGSNIDFFSIIKGLKLSDLTDTWGHDWTLVNAHGSRNNTSGYIYAMIDYLNTPDANYIDNTDKEIDVRGLLPSIYLHSLISQIITDAGFTAQGDFMSNANYMSVLIPLIGTKNPNSKLKILKTDSQPLAYTTGLAIRYDVINFDESTVTDPYNIFETRTVDYEENPFSPQVPEGTTFEILADGDYQFRVFINYYIERTTNNDLFIQIQRRRAGVNTQLEFAFDIRFASGVYSVTFDSSVFTLERGDLIFITGECQSNDVTILPQSYLECIAQPEQFAFGEYASINTNLPNIKQSDLLKDTCQKFGLILQVDNQTRVVSIRQFSEIIDNIPNALDWSDKVDYSEKPEIEFDSGYARRNLCVYKDDDSVIKPSGTDSEIVIDNDNLEAEKELFESPFAASEQVERFGGYSIAQIKLFTDIGTADETLEKVEPRYLIRRTEAFSIFTYTDGTSDLTATEIPLTHFILGTETFNAGFSNNLLENSSDLIAMIQNFRAVKMLLRINAADINQLDFFTSVWIELKGQLGCYFYISEIKQFKVTSKESTEVSLGKLIT